MLLDILYNVLIVSVSFELSCSLQVYENCIFQFMKYLFSSAFDLIITKYTFNEFHFPIVGEYMFHLLHHQNHNFKD